MRSAMGLAMGSVMELVLRSFIGSVLGSLSTCHELYRASQSSDQVITALIDKCRYRESLLEMPGQLKRSLHVVHLTNVKYAQTRLVLVPHVLVGLWAKVD